MSLLTVQQMLKSAGFDPGPLDGQWGPRTAFALDAALAKAPQATPQAGDMDPEFFRDMKADLVRDEGCKPSAYKDHLGYVTIGVGRLIDGRKGGRLTQDEIDYLLANDIRQRWKFLEAKVPAWQSVKGNPARMRALLNMSFQLGEDGLLAFTNSLGLIRAREWDAAGRALRKSLWYQQTPERASRVIKMIETGKP